MDYFRAVLLNSSWMTQFVTDNNYASNLDAIANFAANLNAYHQHESAPIPAVAPLPTTLLWPHLIAGLPMMQALRLLSPTLSGPQAVHMANERAELSNERNLSSPDRHGQDAIHKESETIGENKRYVYV